MAKLKLSTPAIYTDEEGTQWIELRQLVIIAEMDMYRWEKKLVKYLVLSDEIQARMLITLFHTHPDRPGFRAEYAYAELKNNPDLIYASEQRKVLVKKELGGAILSALKAGVVRFTKQISESVDPNSWNFIELPQKDGVRRFKCLIGYNKKDEVVPCPY